MGNSPLGTVSKFNTLLADVANRGGEAEMKKVLGSMQRTITVFKYHVDAVLNRSFAAAGSTPTTEMSHADKFILELKSILLAWEEWEPNYYNHVISLATEWLTTRGAMVAQRFAVDAARLR